MTENPQDKQIPNPSPEQNQEDLHQVDQEEIRQIISKLDRESAFRVLSGKRG